MAVSRVSMIGVFGFLALVSVCGFRPELGAGEGDEANARRRRPAKQCNTQCGRWAGIFPTVVIPWGCDGGVDEASLAAQIDYQLKGGVHGLLVLGTIGEGEYADVEERAQVIGVAVGSAKGCVPIVVGIHTTDMEEATAQIMQARELGANAVLIKYHRRDACDTHRRDACATLSFEKVLGFYGSLADLQLLPIIYYHYPGQTGLSFPPDQIAQILSLDGVVGIKESTLNLNEMQQHIQLTQGLDKAYFTGTALHMTQFLDIGGSGVMGPEAVLMPRTTVRAYRTYRHGQRETARVVQKDLFAIAPILRDGQASERSSRTVVMNAQDHHVTLPMGRSQPQSRLKAGLDTIGIPTSAEVKPPLRRLGLQDQIKVNRTMKKIRRMEGMNL